jgi:pimeloyl-ACP methyl ester carboxylesterase
VRTVLWGESMGGLVTAAAIEAHPDVFDGAIVLCGVVGGSTRWWDVNGLALAEAYAAAFGWPAAWGTPEVPDPDLSWADDVAPLVAGQIADPANRSRFEFVRVVIGADPADFYSGGLWLTMSLATEARLELARRAGGQPLAVPLGGWTLDDDARAELAGSGVSVDVDTLLGAMNRRAALVETDPVARSYLTAHAEPTGVLARPVLTVHTAADTIVALDNEERYRDRVSAAGASSLLAQAVVDRAGHCTFPSEVLARAVSTMTAWLETGVAPSQAQLAGLASIPDR